MSRLDIVIFGATGFTGKHTVIHMVNFAKKYQIGSWGVAGRSESKLQEIMKEVTAKTGADVSGVKRIIADINDDKSLKAMCAQAKVLVNCCGPYRLYGEPVVKAAIENKTHYLDVSGEPQFMELMQLRYHDMAREAGVFVISACGWDSIPSDMGVLFLQQHFQGTLNSVRSYVKLYVPPEVMAKDEGRGVINYGTWESLIYGLANYRDLSALRRRLYPEPMPKLIPKMHRLMYHKKDGKGYYLPFLGSDESVVYRTQRYFYKQENQRPVQFKAYIRVGSAFNVLIAFFAAILLFLLAKFSFTRSILLKHPKLCSMGKVSKDGPTDAVMNNSYFSFELVGEGWPVGVDIENTKPTKKLVAKVSGVNPGYGATCVALLAAAVTLLHERQAMPASAGVLTTGAAFKNTNLIKKLIENNLMYEILENK